MDILKEEKNLWKKGFKGVVGLDEVGRGPLAGPVTAAAVFVPRKFKIPENLKKIRDSKKLSPQRREELCKILKKHPQIKWGTANVSENKIDKINIFEASKLAMLKAVKNLEIKNSKLKINHLILDGNFKINSKIPQKPIIKGDSKVFSIMAASVIAKVTRDNLMMKLNRKYPKYKFKIHKGYPTELHQKLLKKYGPCKIHRKTFGPVRNLIKPPLPKKFCGFRV